MMQPIIDQRVGQRLRHVILTDQLVKAPWAIFAC